MTDSPPRRSRRSAGLLLYRGAGDALEVWIGHLGGPFWARKDAGAWSIPKGEYDPTEDPLSAAVREFGEEMGVPAPALDYRLLGDFRQRSGKIVTVFAAAAPDFDLPELRSNTFELVWPPHSGRTVAFPEIDRAEWVALPRARELVAAGQVAALDAVRATG